MNLKSIFSEIPIDEIFKKFETEDACLAFLAQAKWNDQFRCKKCGHDNYCKGKTLSSRRCTRCKHDESATAHTPFHGCRMPLNLAFKMAYEICCQPGISTYKLSDIHQTRQMTCWKLKKKVLECINPS